jgi:hypothetical protein
VVEGRARELKDLVQLCDEFADQVQGSLEMKGTHRRRVLQQAYA